MRIAYNPLTAAALTTAPANNDITFDLRGLNIFVRGVKFKGTDTTYSVFKKHTSSSGGGYNGLVPVPSYTSTNVRFLREDGTWQIMPDTKVTQSETTTANFRPVILGYQNSTDVSTLNLEVTNLVYTTTSVYVLPSTGFLYANKLFSGGKEVATKDSLDLSRYVTIDTTQNITSTKIWPSASSDLYIGYNSSNISMIKYVIHTSAGWARGYGFSNQDEESYCSFGAYGQGTTLVYQYVGNDYQNPWQKWNSTRSDLSIPLFINNNKVWHAGNDGEGSGMDADLIDGTHKKDLFTLLTSSASTNLSVTIGGTTKAITDLYATSAEKLSTGRTINGTLFDGTENIVTSFWGISRTITLTGAVTGSVSINGSKDVTINTTLQSSSIDGKYVGGNKQASHGSAGTSYTADTYSSNFVNKTYAAFAERGSWSYANNGYVTTDLGGNIPLAGTAIFQWGASDTNKTLLFITPENYSNVSSPFLNEMLFYTSNGSGYNSAWTRVVTNRNYTSIIKKLGSSTVGGPTKPIYLDEGVPTAFSLTVGSAALPVYLNAGAITSCVGSSIFSNLSNSGNNISITVAGQNRVLTPAYATVSGSTRKLYKIGSSTNSLTWTTSSNLVGNGITAYTDTSTSERWDNYGAIFQFSNVDNPDPGTSNHWLTLIWSGTTAKLGVRWRVNTGTWTAMLTILTSSNYYSYINKLKVTLCNSSSNSGLWNTIKGENSSYIGTFNVYDVYNNGGPNTYGNIIEIVSPNTNHWQPLLWFSSGKTGSLLHRNKNYNDDTWGSWYTILDSNNYTNYIGDGDYVTSLGTKGNYLTWTKNGITNNITVPFATKSTWTTYMYYGAISNLNSPSTISTEGYRLVYDSYSVTATNLPVSQDNANSLLTLFKSKHGTSSLYLSLLAFPSNGRFYYRYSTSGSFSAWKTIAFTTDVKDPTDYYWANIAVSTTSSTTTSPTFNAATVTKLNVKGTANSTGYISSDTSYNMYAKVNNLVMFVLDGSQKAIRSSSAIPSTISLGTSSVRWSNLYSVSGNFSGDVTANRIKITDTDAVKHIEFSRTSYNYLTAPAGTDSSINFIVNGQDLLIANADLSVRNGLVCSGTNNATSLGNSTYRWSGLYSVLGNFSSNVTANGFIKSGSSDSYVLLGGGGHKLLSSISGDGKYVLKTGDTMTGNLKITGGTDTRNMELSYGSLKFNVPTGGWAAGFSYYSTSGSSLGQACGAYGSGNSITYYFYGGSYNSPKMVISPAGNVGIGVTSPSYSLHTSGSIYSSKGFIKSGSSNSYVLLGGGGHKALTDFGYNVKYYAKYSVTFNPSPVRYSFSRTTGNYNFISSITRNNSGSISIALSYPSGYTFNNTIINIIGRYYSLSSMDPTNTSLNIKFNTDTSFYINFLCF